ncbi:MAG: hypothetical protein A2381_12325 [Bdellovibrionales bacterium RIFOXYB1_FULL_37_110]|nr:MAG: hypothetical protein A2181_02045 [Bdellovibrionales bacterium RIFOXYA1_FULL_38_20]OFZ52282.1 MAG: hypothetical protein A2417_06165 [Bdellovibrionales bacterium RIFOXYC1_FULL_37_79]OFZ57269.1 MAG: hypothetical protein A2381_12325 [Bdellovibrionales bacterium RIFOXYB1_FULL_37_110]
MNHQSQAFKNLLSDLKKEEEQIKKVNLEDVKKQASKFKKAILIRNIEEFILLPMFILASLLYAFSKNNIGSVIFSLTMTLGLIIIQVLVYKNYKNTKNISLGLSVEAFGEFEKTHLLERLSALKKVRFVVYGLFPAAGVFDRIYFMISLEHIRTIDWAISGLYLIALTAFVAFLVSYLEKMIRNIKFEIEQVS